MPIGWFSLLPWMTLRAWAAVAAGGSECPESALCSRWQATRDMGEDAPFLPLPPSSTLRRSDYSKRGLGAAFKKAPRLVVLRLLRLRPLLLLTSDRRARAAD